MINNEIEIKKRCESFMDTVFELYDVSGIAVGISYGGFEFTGARGYRNYVTKEKLCKQDVFHCTSVSKLFTSMAVMLLIDDEKISLEDRLVDILPYISIADRRCEDIRLFQLLCHTSGMSDVEDYRWHEHLTHDTALKEYIMSEEICGAPLLCSPHDNRFMYSNTAYEILGLIIEEISGMCYEDFVSERILKPLHMDNSTMFTPKRTGGDMSLDAVSKAGLAMPHKKDSDRSIILEDVYPYTRPHSASSTLTSTAEDLLKWGRGIMNKRLLSEDGYEKLFSEYAEVSYTGEKMGLGWFMREQKGYRLFGHEGADNGFRTAFWICPEKDAVIAVLSNISNAPVKTFAGKIFDMICKF